MKRFFLALLISLLSWSAQADITGYATVGETIEGGQVTKADLRCRMWTTAPATDWQNFDGFSNACSAFWNHNGSVIFQFAAIYSPSPLPQGQYVELYQHQVYTCLQGGLRYHVHLSGSILPVGGSLIIHSDDSPNYNGFCYC